jgi:hypothetical protein
MTEDIREWVFTFGVGHPVFAGCYIKIQGSWDRAREKMLHTFGDKWAMQYPSETEAGVAKYNLNEVVIRTPNLG